MARPGNYAVFTSPGFWLPPSSSNPMGWMTLSRPGRISSPSSVWPRDLDRPVCLAHNYLAGEAFGLLQVGQEIQLVDGSGTVSTYIVKQILHFQAIESGSTVTRFLDLESRTLISSADLFSKVYSRPGEVVFQTCIQAGGDPSWGRLFVIATPSD